jgi:hypothetical protein
MKFWTKLQNRIKKERDNKDEEGSDDLANMFHSKSVGDINKNLRQDDYLWREALIVCVFLFEEF